MAKSLFIFSFLLFSGLTTQGRSVGKCHMTNITHHKSYVRTLQCHVMESHDECGRVVHRPCSSCISSVWNPMGTLSSSPC